MSDPYVNNGVGLIVVLSLSELKNIINKNCIDNFKNIIYGNKPQEYFGISMCLMPFDIIKNYQSIIYIVLN